MNIAEEILRWSAIAALCTLYFSVVIAVVAEFWDDHKRGH